MPTTGEVVGFLMDNRILSILIRIIFVLSQNKENIMWSNSFNDIITFDWCDFISAIIGILSTVTVVCQVIYKIFVYFKRKCIYNVL